MGFKSEKVSIKEIVQRELAEIDAYLYENDEIVRYEIALESVPEKIRDYARENQAIYGWEDASGKLVFVKKEEFVKTFAADFCETHTESAKDRSLSSEMFRHMEKVRKRRTTVPAILLAILVLGIAFGGAGYFLGGASGIGGNNENAEKAEALQAEFEAVSGERDSLLAEKEILTAEKEELQTQVDTLTEENETLAPDAEQWNANKDKLGWYNSNVVIVYNDSTHLYHSYGCARHSGNSHSIFDKSSAKNRGYLACPHCLGN